MISTHSAKPRVALITPFPDDKSGCADYSYATAKILSQDVILDIYTDSQNIKPLISVNSFKPISSVPYISHQYDAVISVIGNSHFHSKIYDYVLNYGGSVIEHDNRLLDFIVWKYGTEYAASIASLELDKPVTSDDISEWIHHTEKTGTLFLNNLFDSSSHFFMHSKNLISELKERTGRQALYLPFCYYNDLGVDNITPRLKFSIRNLLGINKSEIAIMTFGSLGDSKYSTESISAMKIVCKYYPSARLYFIGNCNPSMYGDVLKKIGKYTDIVSVKKNHYYSIEEYQDYLIAADYGLQLRRHKFGGLSGGLMDCIAAGKPTISNKDLSVSSESPNYIYTIQDDPTSQVIAEGIIKAIENKYSPHKIESQRVEFLKNHNFRIYVDSLISQLGLSEDIL